MNFLEADKAANGRRVRPGFGSLWRSAEEWVDLWRECCVHSSDFLSLLRHDKWEVEPLTEGDEVVLDSLPERPAAEL